MARRRARILGPATTIRCLIKEKDGRRNRYRIEAHLPLPEPTTRERTVGEVLALLTGADATGLAAAAAGSPDPVSGQDS